MTPEDECSQASIEAALVKVKEVIRIRRTQGVRQAQEIEGVFIWRPTEQGWGLVKYEPVDD
jgi:hypothetical protein